ncbi:MAG: hypothetical protein O2931_17325 [Planctomycetota bacterium]|nr:hypothetical protein [Planctomycetota bacterium]MDA1180543.1 hypothetical protein [Planctomycetota bacterium]
MLNEYFVPIYVSNTDYTDEEITSAEERALYDQIFASARKMNKPAGLVQVYIFDSKGNLSTSKHVKDVLEVENLLSLLREQIRQYGVQPGKMLEAPKPQLVRPLSETSDLLLHFATRVEPGNGTWPGIAEEFVRLNRQDWQQLVGPPDAEPGNEWELPKELAESIFTRIYPPTGAYDPDEHVFHKSSLTARVISVEDGTRIVALGGEMSMDHGIRPRDTSPSRVNAVVTGYLRYKNGASSLPQIRLSTFSATYGDGRFDNVIYSEDVTTR